MTKDFEERLNSLNYRFNDIADSISNEASDIDEENNSNNLFDIGCALDNLKDELVETLKELWKLESELEEEEIEEEGDICPAEDGGYDD